MATFVSGLKEFSLSSLGALGRSLPWRLAIAALELLPMIMVCATQTSLQRSTRGVESLTRPSPPCCVAQGPERLYNLVIQPLFLVAEPQVDAVVDELTRVQSLAKDAITAIKQTDAKELTERAADIAGVIAEDSKALLDTVQSEAKEAVETVHTKAAQLGWLWWKEGVVAVLEEAVIKMEQARDQVIDRVPVVVSQLKHRWNAKEAFISKKRTSHTLNPEEEEEMPAGKKGVEDEDEDGELVNAEEAETDTNPTESKEELPTEREGTPRDQNEPLQEPSGGELKSESELLPVESPPATQPASALRHRSKTRRDDQADSAAPTPPRTDEHKRMLLAKPGPSGRSKDTPAKCEAAALAGDSSLHQLPPEEIARIAFQEMRSAGGDRSLDPAQHHPVKHAATIQVTADSGGHKHAPVSKDAVRAVNKTATQQSVTHCTSHANA